MQAKVVDICTTWASTAAGLATRTVYVATVGHTWTLSPTMLLDGNFGMNRQDQTAQGVGLRHQLRDRDVRHSRDQRPGSAAERHAGVQRRAEHPRQQRHLASAGASRDELHDHDEPDEARLVRTSSAPGSTSSAISSITGSRSSGRARAATSTSRATSPGSPATRRTTGTVRALPARPDERLRQEHPVRRHDGP